LLIVSISDVALAIVVVPNPILPLELINKNVDEPLVTVNDPDPKLIEALIEPLAICDKFDTPAVAFNANDAVVANDDVPCNEPVNDPVNEPVALNKVPS
jgi:hypothetical protein